MGVAVANSLFGKGPGRLCAVAAAPSAREMARLVRLALRETRTVELRLDWLQTDREREKFLKWLKRSRFRNVQFLATCRRRLGGGELPGDAGEELHWLMRAKQAGCTWCDLEVETLRELPGGQVRGYDVPNHVLLSIHDFRRTPNFPAKISLPKNAGVDAVKIAAMAQSIGDSVRMLHLARVSPQLVAVPMGEKGLPARILALKNGSGLAYAPVAAATAPGQVSLHDLKYLYRAHQLNAKTKIFGVIGNPISHSLSPLLHNTGYVAARVNAVYLPFLVEKLSGFIRAIPEFELSGFSVTLPHKQAIFRYLSECDPLAEKIGAVNTVTVAKNGNLHGSNTDYVGVLRALQKKLPLNRSRVLIFGAGGSARAAAFALASAGAEVLICARREEAAKKLARACGAGVVQREALRREKFDAILNSTPVGMHPHSGISPLHANELNCSVLMDLIYRPLETRLLRLGKARGIQTVSGLEMFLAQGFAQWELWTGKRAPEQPMRKAVLHALRSEQQAQ